MKELIKKYKMKVALVGTTIVITSTLGQCSFQQPPPPVEEVVEVVEVVEEPSPIEEAPTPSEEVDAAE
tara:strand:+ start:1160 stop:1363 length:204 start_codon:yes stop_codon:yes gene_type:complete